MTPLLAASTPAVFDLLTPVRVVTSLFGMFVVAIVVGRLLGVRRGPAAIAVLLAKNHERGEANFLRNLWLFSTFATMSATVWIEMLAKPGTLARAQTSLTTFPRPIHAIRQRTRRLGRYAQITRIAARNGFGKSLGVADEEAYDGRAPAARGPARARARRRPPRRRRRATSRTRCGPRCG